jgi:hypothetical protein
MSLIDKLPTTLLGPKPPSREFTLSLSTTSTLHKETSINGTPELYRNRKPSGLDLDGKTPPTYKDNSPEGARF